jgi:hypothetical protein
MKLLRDLSPQLALAGIVALQLSCGDSSGPGPAASSIDANSSQTLAAGPGTQVAELPSVIVRDENGSPLGGVSVTFAVTGGGGSVTGARAVSNSSGIATVGSWTLGPVAGTNTLTASTGSLPAVTFTAEGADPCTVTIPHTLGTTSSGQLTRSDCDLGDGSFVDLYSVSIPSPGTYTFTQSGSFDTYLLLLGSVSLIAENDNGPQANSSVVKAILPAGSFILGANSLQASVTGAYTVASAVTTAEITNCEIVFTTPGISTQQSLQSSDCSTNGIFADDYIIFLAAGRTITASMSSSALDSDLEIHASGSTTIVASNDNIDGTTQDARVTFTPVSSGYYVIRSRSAAAGATGAYTLTVQ